MNSTTTEKAETITLANAITLAYQHRNFRQTLVLQVLGQKKNLASLHDAVLWIFYSATFLRSLHFALKFTHIFARFSYTEMLQDMIHSVRECSSTKRMCTGLYVHS